jgi:hypothetical protein
MKGGMEMNCQEVRDKLSAYLDNELDAHEKECLAGHLAKCTACQEEMEDLQKIVEQLSSLEEMIPPLEFHRELFAKLEQVVREKKKEVPQMKKGIFRGFLQNLFGAKRYSGIVPVAVALVLLLLVSPVLVQNVPILQGIKNEIAMDTAAPEDGGSVSFNSTARSWGIDDAHSVSPEMDKAGAGYNYMAENQATGDGELNQLRIMATTDPVPPTEPTVSGETARQTQSTGTEPIQTSKQLETEILDRKIIKNAHLSLTVDDYEQAVDEIRAKVVTLNGYVAYETEHTTDKLGTKRGSMQVRIPQPGFDTFLAGLQPLGEMKRKEIDSQDVTEEYIDITGRLSALRVKEERLLDILTKSGSLNEILAVENELANTRSQLETTEGRLRYLNNQTSFSTISISLEQASVSTQQVTAGGLKGVGQRAKAAFIEAINNILVGTGNLLVFISAAIPYLVILTLLGLIVIAVWRGRRNKEKPADKEE